MLVSICGALNMALLWIDLKGLKPHPLPSSVPLRWLFGEKNVWLRAWGTTAEKS